MTKLLFNDVPENANDTLQLSLPLGSTVEGGTITLQNNSVLYTPKAGFSGQDRFTYRLLGGAGGTNDTTVQVAVTTRADDLATVVNFKWRDNQTVDVDLMAQPNTDYQLQSSPNLITWTPVRVIAGSTADPMTFSFTVDKTVRSIYFRAPRATAAIPASAN